jgi:hypothetical protein
MSMDKGGRERSSPRFIVTAVSAITATAVAKPWLKNYSIEHGLRTHNTLLNLWDHTGNVCDSITLTSAVAIGAVAVSQKFDVFRQVPKKLACTIGAITLGAGLLMNTVAETEPFAEPFVVLLHETPDQYDAAWGDVTSIAMATGLTLLMRERKEDGDVPIG